MLFIFLVGICRPFVIEDQITVLTPSSHTFLAYIKGVQPILDLNVLHIKGLLLLVYNDTPEVVSSYPDLLMVLLKPKDALRGEPWFAIQRRVVWYSPAWGSE